MKTRFALSILTLFASPGLAQPSLAQSGLAQPGPSEAQQRQACMGDALRLCSADVPNRAKIRRCMAGKHDQLSPTCRAIFDASLQALTTAQHGER